MISKSSGVRLAALDVFKKMSKNYIKFHIRTHSKTKEKANAAQKGPSYTPGKDSHIIGQQCLSYLLGVKQWFWYLIKRSYSKGPQQELLQHIYN